LAPPKNATPRHAAATRIQPKCISSPIRPQKRGPQPGRLVQTPRLGLILSDWLDRVCIQLTTVATLAAIEVDAARITDGILHRPANTQRRRCALLYRLGFDMSRIHSNGCLPVIR
jgi:hypothetical protein